MSDQDYASLVPGERKRLEQAKRSIDAALKADKGSVAAHQLEQVEDILRQILRRQWWSNR